MPTYRVTLRDASKAYGKVADDVRAAALRGIRKAAVRGVARVIEAVDAQPHPPVDRSVYKSRWKSAPMPDGAVLYNDAGHAVFIEFGVRAANVKIGRKLINALMSWGVRKGLCGEDEAEEFAWAVAQSFRRRGIFNREGGKGGYRILETVMVRDMPKLVRQEIERAIAEATR